MRFRLISPLIVTLCVLGACTKTTTVYVSDTSTPSGPSSSYRSVRPSDPRAWDGRYSESETDFYQFVSDNTRAGELMTSDEVIQLGYFSCEKMAEGLNLADLADYSVDAAAALDLEADYSFKDAFAAITGSSMVHLCPEFLPTEQAPSPSNPEALFVDAVREVAPSPQMNLMSDTELLQNGYGVCGKLRDGSFTVTEMFVGIIQSAATADHLAALTAVLTFGIEYLCPEFINERDEMTRNP